MPSHHYYTMSVTIFVYITITVNKAITLLIDFDWQILFIACAEVPFIRYIDAKVSIPLPTLYREMNIKH
jgi:hypothetical protein